MKTKSKISGYILRGSVAALFVFFVIVALSSAFSLPNDPSNFPVPQNNAPFGVNGHGSASSVLASPTGGTRPLTFADRVAYQWAIEEVYGRHRIWPKANASSKPSLDAVMSQAQIEKKVEDYLRNSRALEDYWQKPITPDQLQAEMERIASHTKQPEVLRELFAALGDDPFVIAECLARPALAERLVTALYAHDERFHGELKRRSEGELTAHRSVKEMKETSGTYSEVEWVKNDNESTGAMTANRAIVVATPLRGVGINVPPAFAGATVPTQARGYSERQDVSNAIPMNDSEWTHNVHRLASTFDEPGAAIPVGKLSSLQEDDGAYYATAVISKGKDRLRLATIAWMKQPFDSWRAKAETQVPVTMAAPLPVEYALPAIADPSTLCTDDTWHATNTTGAPGDRQYHTAVWTGSEMIVWGGTDGHNNVLNTGGRYNPTTNNWTATSTLNAPSGREFHTAVWTGSEMIIWGGASYCCGLNTGARYNPSTDSWTATSIVNAPRARYDHTAVWNGSEMIVWGGGFYNFHGFNFLKAGGRYNPTTDTWTATSTTNAPSARFGHTAKWTGSEMIVWGGDDGTNFLNTGGKYNPGTNNWTATSTSNPPSARYDHTAVWTGSEMIVWGGFGAGGDLNTGGRYNPSTDSWAATGTANAPSARSSHTAKWTGSEMIVWGGADSTNFLNTGARYNPSTDSWTATSMVNAPRARYDHTAVWTGSEMIVWGGTPDGFNLLNTGGRYCAQQAMGPPIVTTNPATFIASFSATLNASLNPHGLATTFHLQYGRTTAYGLTTAPQIQTGNTSRNVTANISSLTPSTTYHFRIVASNLDGTRMGADRAFTTLTMTGPPVVTTNPPTNVTSSSATLHGVVDPHGLNTSVYWQWGLTPSYGNMTDPLLKTGNTWQNETITIQNLHSNQTYHYREVATNADGTVHSSDKTFPTRR